MGAILAGLGFIAVLFLWCRLVPDEQARVRGVILVWIAIPVVEFVLEVARHFYPGLY